MFSWTREPMGSWEMTASRGALWDLTTIYSLTLTDQKPQISVAQVAALLPSVP